MPCCLMLVAAMFPRVALIIMWLGGYSGEAFKTAVWPLLGFLFMPFTTCAYAIGMHEHGSITGWALALVIIGAIIDLGSHGGGARTARTRYVVVRKS
jgi:hypothetical protein